MTFSLVLAFMSGIALFVNSMGQKSAAGSAEALIGGLLCAVAIIAIYETRKHRAVR